MLLLKVEGDTQQLHNLCFAVASIDNQLLHDHLPCQQGGERIYLRHSVSILGNGRLLCLRLSHGVLWAQEDLHWKLYASSDWWGTFALIWA